MLEASTGPAHRREQLVDAGTGIRGAWPERRHQTPVTVDHEVTTELAGVLSGSAELAPPAKQFVVEPERVEAPNLRERAPSQTELTVDGPLLVGQEGPRNVEMFPVGGQLPDRGEGHDRGPHRGELVEALAHGEQMLLAGQSHQVAVEDQQC